MKRTFEEYLNEKHGYYRIEVDLEVEEVDDPMDPNGCLTIKIPVVFEYEISDHGIGPYEFWGSKEVHKDIAASIGKIDPQWDRMKVLGSKGEIPLAKFSGDELEQIQVAVKAYTEKESTWEHVYEKIWESKE